MKDFTFGISYKNFQNEQFGGRFQTSCHDVKSIAGREFSNDPKIKSVTVFDPTGKRWLYLRKNEEGVVVTREEVKSL
jgi:hypothetical protein